MVQLALFRFQVTRMQGITKFFRKKWRTLQRKKIFDLITSIDGVFEGNKKGITDLKNLLSLSADSEGFEPPVPRGTIVFKTTAFDHSANYPRAQR